MEHFCVFPFLLLKMYIFLFIIISHLVSRKRMGLSKKMKIQTFLRVKLGISFILLSNRESLMEQNVQSERIMRDYVYELI